MIFVDIIYGLSINSLGNRGRIPCSFDMDYDFDGCASNQTAFVLQKEFGCTLPWVQGTGGNGNLQIWQRLGGVGQSQKKVNCSNDKHVLYHNWLILL